ncbi:hypothetical protein ASPZODRAFT_148662 [Penicilliopsis zonata CBS 506.65]|uniref:UDP-glucose:glycoprotein glucosyltransferase n=1 Tax=Penicilliopsis zonata CBS 506.65 TaxID=1073090 RepID=A0A1L9SWE6_9EURO|nr:hypothetical protein ASPZODRAFT_148662 [Penicilliopsis zonata CBS 506.65]OJJ51373.1 hypothetical protein ASPZODRAFT_148662 [Penicilliopsis zonata CBS 506.65]
MAGTMSSASSWQWCVVIVAGVLACLAHASQSVNVALQASFDSAPFLLELLETAAEENPASYFPLLDHIADGTFDAAVTDKELYDQFLETLKQDGLIEAPESFSSFKLSLAIRSTAPRIEAHYQYYNTSVQQSLMAAQDAACPVWIHYEGKQYCSSAMERAQQDVSGELDSRKLPFDRVSGDVSLPPAVLYADVASPLFKEYHQTLSALAKEGQLSYRVRYRPPQHWAPRPLFVSGYGVELALKRTDYIVIDDRDAEKRELGKDELQDESPDDLRPLSSSEVTRLGWNTASYVMNSADPLDTLVKVSQDFPKYSSVVAGHNATKALVREVHSNRGQMYPSGHNIMWINGVQMDARKIDAFSLLDHLRRERNLIDRFRNLGLSAQETVKLLSHRKVARAQADNEPQRYNYRDEIEGGRVVLWLNDIEKDVKYESWTNELAAYLQRSHPGQLPAVRRDLHNIVFPVDLTNPEDLELVIQTIQIFVKKRIPVRFGLVPTAISKGSIGQLKITHYLHETFGLESLIHYLEQFASKKKVSSPDKFSFQAATKERETRDNVEALTFEQVLASDELDEIVSRTVSYQKRLDIHPETPYFFVNGVPVVRDDTWVQEMSSQISQDLQFIQRGIFNELYEEDTWLAGVLLAKAFTRRKTLIVPVDAKDVRFVDVVGLSESYQTALVNLPRVSSAVDKARENVHMIVVGDFDSEDGLKLLADALNVRREHPEAELLFLDNSPSQTIDQAVSHKFYGLLEQDEPVDVEKITAAVSSITETPDAETIFKYWTDRRLLAEALGFPTGTNGLVVNGRAVGPISQSSELVAEDLEQLLAYEQEKRITPIAEAIEELAIQAKPLNALEFAKLTSLVALSTISDVPEGIFESPADTRFSPSDNWNTSHSVVIVSNSEDPVINIVAAIDPTSEVAQRWLPILKVLSQLAGVEVKISMNPKDEMHELPTKRFYRYVLDSEPSFDTKGSLLKPQASFSGVPREALLTLGMDVPPSWLVAPKESLHDLDNIKLSSVKGGLDVEALYSLEHILIEGHSRDTTVKSPPSGVQLLLGTEENPHFADTIIMANLGYFQFKAQPGFWKINLKPGNSQRIFNLDSVGGLGYSPQPGDENNEVALLSFQGATLFPRLSRKKGRENDDVLETGPKAGSAMDYVSKGLGFAQGVLSGVGLKTSGGAVEKQADINIFSVASGHLYERMLNIMMVSVMRHTKHSVKFWFIEQFLSPSFKSSLPYLADEYGFSYEMVTYKWPHWLRPQSEKQREIWGYKILFLDVLFPLSLDKVIFVDADQIVRTDMYDLVSLDLEGAPYGFTPMCDSREEMEGFRFWKQGYWKNFLRGLPYHISALYVVDLNRFRAIAAGDRLRGQYQLLSADPASLSNLDQDLPNHMQHYIPIKSLPQEWLWCETWCSDESLGPARTIDLCNNPLTKEPKLDRARRQVPEWTVYDDEIAELAKRVAEKEEQEQEAATFTDGADAADWDKDEL